MTTEKNWAGNYQYGAARVLYPQTVEQVQELVAHSRKVKVLGTRHSFNSIADTTENLISLKHLNRVIEIDHEQRTVAVEGGVRYGELGQQLHHAGHALHNLASLPHISVAGACATATHGSGDNNASLASAISAIEMVTADGAVVVLSRQQNDHEFRGAVVGLGGLGVVTKLWLDIVPTYEVRQNVYENLSLAQVEAHLDEITSSAYSVSLFTDWQGTAFNQVWLKRQVTGAAPFEAEPEWFGAMSARRKRHPIEHMSPENCTEQMGIPGPWHERLPHFRLDFTPSVGNELQTEYLVPRHHALAAFHAISKMGKQIAPLLQISEVRTIAADDFWMSPFYQQPCVGIHFTWVPDWPAVRRLLPLIKEQLAPLNARPHWGKLFTMPHSRLQSLYTKLPEFQQLLRAYDPEGKFRNDFLDATVFGMTN